MKGMRASTAAGATIAIALLTAAAAVGCNGNGPTDVVQTELRSPDGVRAAYVVMRSQKPAHQPRQQREYLLVLPTNDLPLNRADLTQVAPMEATGLYGLRLEWPAADEVRLVCDDCGLPQGRVLRQADHVGAVKVVYSGFGKAPAHG